MSYKLSDFFIGVIDFFAVLFPGTIFIYLLTPFEQEFFGENELLPSITSSSGRWITFFVLSYIAGHII